MNPAWIHGRRWDLTWLIGSAVVVPIGILLVWTGASSDLMNLAVTALMGGPHLFSTFLTTYFNPRFRRRHGFALAAITLLVPAFVWWMALRHFQWLMTFFVLWASLHVVQQNAYLAQVYRRRSGRPDPGWSRFLDLALLFLSFYPVASFKLVHDDFMLGSVRILMPSILKYEFVPRAISLAFTAALLGWIAKTLAEQRRGELQVPKTILIAVTTMITFVVPCAASGERLELAFQTVNAWHSIQYLGITWLVLAIQKKRGEIASPLVARLAGPGRPVASFYGFCFLFTATLLGFTYTMARLDPLGGVSRPQYYYMGVLSLLFIHYALDSWLFFAAGREESRPDTIPLVLPSRA
jgi:hypothetical protein